MTMKQRGVGGGSHKNTRSSSCFVTSLKVLLHLKERALRTTENVYPKAFGGTMHSAGRQKDLAPDEKTGESKSTLLRCFLLELMFSIS